MHWLTKSPEHQQAWYWLCSTNNMCCYSRINFIYLSQTKSKIWSKMQIYILYFFKQLSMVRVNHGVSQSDSAIVRSLPVWNELFACHDILITNLSTVTNRLQSLEHIYFTECLDKYHECRNLILCTISMFSQNDVIDMWNERNVQSNA